VIPVIGHHDFSIEGDLCETYTRLLEHRPKTFLAFAEHFLAPTALPKIESLPESHGQNHRASARQPGRPSATLSPLQQIVRGPRLVQALERIFGHGLRQSAIAIEIPDFAPQQIPYGRHLKRCSHTIPECAGKGVQTNRAFRRYLLEDGQSDAFFQETGAGSSTTNYSQHVSRVGQRNRLRLGELVAQHADV